MGKEIDESSQATKAYQLQTISNLHNPGIPNEIISLQLDITEVEKAIDNIKKEQEELVAQGSYVILFYKLS